jgi:integrase
MGLVGTKDTSAAMGHSSEAFTMRTYQHRVADVNADLVAQAIATVYGG